jgi:hypothetical protein
VYACVPDKSLRKRIELHLPGTYLNLNLNLHHTCTYLYSITTDKRVKYCQLRATGIVHNLSRENHP